jgi:uncharacterized membrane protein (Fun14 family)
MEKQTVSEDYFSLEHLQAIGMVTIEWSFLESIMEKAIWALAGLEPRKDQ